MSSARLVKQPLNKYMDKRLVERRDEKIRQKINFDYKYTEFQICFDNIQNIPVDFLDDNKILDEMPIPRELIETYFDIAYDTPDAYEQFYEKYRQIQKPVSDPPENLTDKKVWISEIDKCPKCGEYFINNNKPEGGCCVVGNKRKSFLKKLEKERMNEECERQGEESAGLLQRMAMVDIFLRIFHGDL
jgi:hypothetical protein